MKSVEYAVDPMAHELDNVVRSKIPVPGIALLFRGSRVDIPLTTVLVNQGCKNETRA